MSAYDGVPGRERAAAQSNGNSPQSWRASEVNGQAERLAGAIGGAEAAGATSHFAPCGADVGRVGTRGLLGKLVLNEAFVTEAGAAIPAAELSYRTWGRLTASADNAIVVCHALTGSSDLEAWWPALLGPGRALDPERDFVVAIDALGSVHGSTGPASLAADGEPWGRRFPKLTVRDLVRGQQLVLDALGVRAVQLALGGSLGGMQALEFALIDPRVRSVAVIAAPARHEAWAMGWSAAQRQALAADPAWPTDPFAARAGLAAARAIAMLSYRAPQGFEERFGRRRGDRHAFAVGDWLAHHGEALARRFDPLSYANLLDTMDAHDIGAGRGGVAAALAGLRVPLLAVSIESDQLYPSSEVDVLVQGAPYGELDQLRSPHGHDAFLIDQRVVESIVRRFRERVTRHERELASTRAPLPLREPGAEDDDARRERTPGLSMRASERTPRSGANGLALARGVDAHDERAREHEWPAYRVAGGVA